MRQLATASLPLLLVCGSIAGCTMPAVAPKPPAFQDSEVTVRDWDHVAQQIADEMAVRGLLPNPLAMQPSPPPPYPYYIALQAPDSRFLREVRQQLQNEILHRGGSVRLSPVGATIISLDVDVVPWRGPRYPGGLATLVGLATGTGILLADAAPLSPAAGFGIATGIGMAIDTVTALTPHTKIEAVWQASAIVNDTLVFDVRSPIYIDSQDIGLHFSHTRLAAMSSPAATPTGLPVRLRYDP